MRALRLCRRSPGRCAMALGPASRMPVKASSNPRRSRASTGPDVADIRTNGLVSVPQGPSICCHLPALHSGQLSTNHPRAPLPRFRATYPHSAPDNCPQITSRAPLPRFRATYPHSAPDNCPQITSRAPEGTPGTCREGFDWAGVLAGAHTRAPRRWKKHSRPRARRGGVATPKPQAPPLPDPLPDRRSRSGLIDPKRPSNLVLAPPREARLEHQQSS